MSEQERYVVFFVLDDVVVASGCRTVLVLYSGGDVVVVL